MNKHYIIGNWKSNKTLKEAEDWIKEFTELLKKTPLPSETNSEVVICAAYHHLPLLKDYILKSDLEVKLGAQDISPFPSGPYTGEVSAQSLSGLIDYCLIGHSERRQYFNETDEIIEKKAQELKKNNISPILCAENDTALIPTGVGIIAFEPSSAIGTGNAADPESVNVVAKTLHQKAPESVVLYGGSVSEENASQFVKLPNIGGLLIGSKSLTPNDFYQLLYATISS